MNIGHTVSTNDSNGWHLLGKSSESSDTVYSKLNLETHQGEYQSKNINHKSQRATENCIYNTIIVENLSIQINMQKCKCAF